ncbi:hypothetical protein [Cellulomonas sp. P24]|uniref:hypothetical protein n=1 Tax=Cellulomonas sp. P24 TaxID=2885206 RepID=UPI00216B6492|nr:hypothetical protein [Cellulomonas sp. P24]MCR6493025.1 hypothetical protein [Cellulomonas sp. P24]
MRAAIPRRAGRVGAGSGLVNGPAATALGSRRGAATSAVGDASDGWTAPTGGASTGEATTPPGAPAALPREGPVGVVVPSGAAADAGPTWWDGLGGADDGAGAADRRTGATSPVLPVATEAGVLAPPREVDGADARVVGVGDGVRGASVAPDRLALGAAVVSSPRAARAAARRRRT